MDRAAAGLQGDPGVGEAEGPTEIDSPGALDGAVPPRQNRDDVRPETGGRSRVPTCVRATVGRTRVPRFRTRRGRSGGATRSLDPSGRALLGSQFAKGFIDAAERFGQVGPGVAHADPDVTVHAELVPRYDQRRLLLQQPPIEVRGIDPKPGPQEANR